MKNEAMDTPASTARQMASLIRGYHSGQRIDESAVLHLLAQMLLGEAKTATDALALLTAAHALMALPISDAQPVESNPEGLAVHCINELIGKAIVALETVTGESCAAFTGQAPAIN
jgi:hypothetical protein